MWWSRPRVKDMPPEDGHLTSEQMNDVVDDQVSEILGAESLAKQGYAERGVLPDHPDISGDALLAYHSQITASGRAQAEFGLSVFEEGIVPPPEPGTRAYDKEFGIEPEPEVVAGTRPTFWDRVRATKEVWLSHR
jgi:hypothetical protein